jgi:hypothetical protein
VREQQRELTQPTSLTSPRRIICPEGRRRIQR